MTIGVSDHALLRFLSRAGGFDVETLRTQMETALARCSAAAEALSASRYTIKKDGMVFVIVDGVCVTVMDKTDKPYIVREEPKR